MKFCKNRMDKKSDREYILPRKVSEIHFFCVVEKYREQTLKGHCRDSDRVLSRQWLGHQDLWADAEVVLEHWE